MKKILIPFVFLFTVIFTYTTIAQEFGSLRKNSVISFPEKIQKAILEPLHAGTYTIGNGGYFPTIDSAFKKLSDDGIAGEIVLELIDELYIAPTTQYGFWLNGPIPGSSSRVTIRPAVNKNVVIQGNGQTTITFNNTNYVTVDGVDLTGATTLTIHTLVNTTFPYNDGIDFMNNSDHNVIQNVILINEACTRGGSGSGFWSTSGSKGAPDSNLIQNNFVKQAGMAFYISAYNSPVRSIGNIVRGNKIGSETDSLIAWGIQLESSQNTVIENNNVQNLKSTVNGSDIVQPGINSYNGFGDTIRNNIVHNLRANAGYTTVGILLSGWAGMIGSNNLVYNNMIYDINSTSTSYDSRVTGIQMWHQNDPKIYYNSVFLSGIGSNKYGSAALYVYLGTANADIRNNVFVNTRDESPYCASAIRAYSTYSTFTSDYNDLYYESSPYNCLVTTGNNDYHTLADWQVTGKDLNSVNEMPNFISPDLHIFAGPSYLESNATPILEITEDFDGNPRHAITPDIGADEFNGVAVGVKYEEMLPTQFALLQNYPNPFNPSTKISWQVPVGGWQTLKLFNVLGNEIETLFNDYKPAGKYEVQFNASTLSSGVYFYQLKAGNYIEIKKMILIK